jgi:hypothetical protein
VFGFSSRTLAPTLTIAEIASRIGKYFLLA